MSTFALAIGRWEVIEVVPRASAEAKRKVDVNCTHEPYPCHVERGDAGPLLPCRVIGGHQMTMVVLIDMALNVSPRPSPPTCSDSLELVALHPRLPGGGPHAARASPLHEAGRPHRAKVQHVQ